MSRNDAPAVFAVVASGIVAFVVTALGAIRTLV
jgi:hypothetical protein